MGAVSMNNRILFWLLFILAGCARPQAVDSPAPAPPAVPVAAPSAPALAEPGRPRPGIRPVPIRDSFLAAVEAGTRSLDGRPGPTYWQQRVRYRIDAELDPTTARLQAQQTVVYHNNSPDTLGVLVFHLYQNLFRPGEMRTERVPVTEGIVLERVVAAGREATPLADRQMPPPTGAVYQVDGTLMALRLPAPLPPRDSVRLEMAWHFTVPPQDAPRMGHRDSEVFTIAQWYPQLAVYDDVHGWHYWPYLGTGEFYLMYGDFDVTITLPEGWLVAATGELQNAQDVLTESVRQRLRYALQQDSVVAVVGPDDLDTGNVTQRAPGGQLSWQFSARDVRDFAFAASNRYLWDATRSYSPGLTPASPPRVVAVHAFYRPEATTWREAARYTRHSIGFHAERWHPYIYPQITSVEGPVYGMEYPMLSFVEAISDPEELYDVINHEVAHQWFPMMVGSRESVVAWQDEGLTTYIANLATMDFFPGSTPFNREMQQYLFVAGTEYEVPLMREPDLAGWEPLPRVVASYSKPSILIRALGTVIGEDVLQRALQEYTVDWLRRHPTELDFFHAVERVAGRDLGWFWYPWWYETGVLDQAIESVSLTAQGAGERAAITVSDLGQAPMPVLLTLTLETGETVRATIPVDVWLDGARRHTETLELAAPLSTVIIDTEGLFPFVDRSKLTWRRRPAPAP